MSFSARATSLPTSHGLKIPSCPTMKLMSICPLSLRGNHCSPSLSNDYAQSKFYVIEKAHNRQNHCVTYKGMMAQISSTQPELHYGGCLVKSSPFLPTMEAKLGALTLALEDKVVIYSLL